MSRTKFAATLVTALVMAGGCSTSSVPTARSTAGSGAAVPYHVYVQTVQDGPAIGIITVPGGRREFLPDAVLTRDGSVAYSAVPNGADTVVRALDAGTGQKNSEQTVSGSYSLPTPDVNPIPAGLSSNGQWLVLEGLNPRPYKGTPQSSRFAVLSTGLSSTVRQFELNGWYRFDAIDDAGSSLYLLEYLPGGQGSYQVRRYDLKKEALDPTVIADKGELGKAMEGVRVAGLYSPDGRWHLGLYARITGVAFLHALPLAFDTPFAFCVDLPARSSDIATQMAWAAVGSADGARLYAANDLLGEVLELRMPAGGQLEAPRVMRHAALPRSSAVHLPWVTDAQAKEFPSRRIVLSRDGRTLYLASGHGIFVIDTASLSVRARWRTSTSFSSLVMSPDGAYLFGSTLDRNEGRLDQVDARTGALAGQVAVPLTILGLERVRGT